MSLTTRVLVFFLTTLAVVLIGFSAGIYQFASWYLNRQADDCLETTYRTLSAAAERGASGVEWEPQERNSNFDFSDLPYPVIWAIYDNAGKVVDGSEGASNHQLVEERLSALSGRSPSNGHVKWRSRSWMGERRDIGPQFDQQVLRERSPDQDPGGAFQFEMLTIDAAIHLAPIQRSLHQLAMSLTALSLAFWLTTLAVGRFVCRRALMPVTRMARSVEQIDVDDLSYRLPATGTRDEFEELPTAFNTLLGRLQESFERQRRFTSDASHQLRTPLTAILGQIEVLQRRERPIAEYQRVLSTVHDRASHLLRIIDSLLFLGRANSDAQLPLRQPLALDDWIPAYLQNWSEHPRSADIAYIKDDPRPCVVCVQSELMEELLNILIDNACKFSLPETPVQIRLGRNNATVEIDVADQGFGIDERDLRFLFTPFQRSDAARQRGIDGVGLGLSIASRLAHAFDGSITVESQLGRGSRFTLHLPLSS